MWTKGCFFLYLLLLSIWDMRERRVPILLLTLGSVISAVVVVCGGITGKIIWLQPIIGALPGVLLLVIAALSGKAGYADGIVLLWIGMVWNYKEGLAVLGISLFMISFVSVVLLLLHKVKKHTRIPYIPFLAAAFFIMSFSGGNYL